MVASFTPTPLQFGDKYDGEKQRRLAEDVVRLAARVSSLATVLNNTGGVPPVKGVTPGYVLTANAAGGYGWAPITVTGPVSWSQLTGIPTSFHPAQHILATTAGLGPEHTVSGLTPGQVLLATGTGQAAFAQLNYAQLGDVNVTGLQVGFSPVWNGTQWVMQNVSQSWSGLTPGTIYTALTPTSAGFLPLTAASITTGVFSTSVLGQGLAQYGIDPTTDTLLTGNGWWTAVQDLDISWSQISNVPKQVSNLGRFSSKLDGLVPNTQGVTGNYYLRIDGTWAPGISGSGGGTVTSITQGAGMALTPNPITGTGVVALAPVANNTVMGNISGSSAAAIGLTGAQVTGLLSVFTTSTQGVVPASGGVANTFLRQDGVFAAVTASTPLTTKGDIFVYSTTNTRLPVGVDGQTLFADSTQTTGLRWGAASPLTTKGDLYTYGPANTRLGVGTNGQVLVADSTQTTGLRWSANTALFAGLAQYGKDPDTDTLLTGNGRWTEIHDIDISWSQISNIPPQVSNLFQSLKNYDFGAPGFTGSPTLFLCQDGKWRAPAGGGGSPLTTKGDLFGFSTVGARIPVGTNGQILTADSTQATGVSWQTNLLNVTPDTHPSSRTIWDDEFEFGSSIDTTGARFSGANAWTWRNQSTATATIKLGSLIFNGTAGVGVSISAVTQPVSGATWEYTTKVSGQNLTAGAASGGLILYNGGNGKILLFAISSSGGTSSQVLVQRFTSFTAFSSTVFSGSVGTPLSENPSNMSFCWGYFKVQYDGTNLKFLYSTTGIQYQQLYTETAAAFMGAVTDIGPGSDNNNATLASFFYDYFRKTA